MLIAMYMPHFFAKPYEKAFEKKARNPETLAWEKNKYQSLLKLKAEAENASASFSQLSALISRFYAHEKVLQIVALEQKINTAVQRILQQQSVGSLQSEIENTFALIKQELMSDETDNKDDSACSLVVNAGFFMPVCAAVISIGALMIYTGGVGFIAGGIVLAVLSAVLFCSAAYSLNVDARFIGDKQIQEIALFIDSLFRFDQGIDSPPSYYEATTLPPSYSEATLWRSQSTPDLDALEPVYVSTNSYSSFPY